MDELDVKIIEMLMKNGRATYTEIAEALGLTDVAILKRIRRLEESSVIRGYSALVDLERIGYKFIVIVGLDVEPEKLLEVSSKAKEITNVRFVALASGDHDIIVILWTRTEEELKKTLEELSKLTGVRRVCPAILLSRVYGEFFI